MRIGPTAYDRLKSTREPALIYYLFRPSSGEKTCILRLPTAGLDGDDLTDRGPIDQ
jgi:hypothetical protein